MAASLSSPAARALQRWLEDAFIEATLHARGAPQAPTVAKRVSPRAPALPLIEGSWRWLFNLTAASPSGFLVRPLTVKLRGRTEAPALGAEGAQFLSARGAKPQAPHGPLQRLLDVPRTARALPNL